MSSDLIQQACIKLRQAVNDELQQDRVEEILSGNLPELREGLLLLLESVRMEWERNIGVRKAFTDPNIPQCPAERGAVQLAELILSKPADEEEAA